MKKAQFCQEIMGWSMRELGDSLGQGDGDFRVLQPELQAVGGNHYVPHPSEYHLPVSIAFGET